jgi:hypothetical protein
MKIEDLELHIHEQRLLVFLETDPQSGKFNQVLLNDEQFKKVSDAIITSKRTGEDLKKDMEEVKLETSVEEYVLPDLQSVNPLKR